MRNLAIKLAVLMIPMYYLGFYHAPKFGVETVVDPGLSGFCAGIFMLCAIALFLMLISKDISKLLNQ